jgi:uncharacterized protein (TIGR00290 family)
MRAISLWSGGKDSCFACYKASSQRNEIASVFNFVDPKSNGSLSHGLSAEVIKRQLAAVDLPSLQKPMPKEGYRRAFMELIDEWKVQNAIEAIVFGDIYLEEHRDWIDKVCDELKVKAILPLWGRDTRELIAEIIGAGFKAIVVSTRADRLGPEWLGRQIDGKFIKDINALGDIDLCGEKGEYHTFVYDGPLFKRRVEFIAGKKSLKGKRWFLEVLPKEG